MNSDIYKIKIFLDFYKIIFDNLKMTLVDTCLFGNVNEKGAIQKNTEYLNKWRVEINLPLRHLFRLICPIRNGFGVLLPLVALDSNQLGDRF